MAYADLTDENAAFERYTRYGGLPPVVNQGTDQNLAYTVLSGIYDTILVRDISQFLQVRNPLVFNDVARYLADTAGSPVSTSKIENRLRSAHRPASNETIERYISGLLNAFLFYNAQRINVKGGAYLQGLAKYYPADLGIRNMLLGYSIEDFGFLLENAVHNELKIRGYQIRVGKIGKAEIQVLQLRACPHDRLGIHTFAAPAFQRGVRGFLQSRKLMFRVADINRSPRHLRCRDCRPFFFGRCCRVRQFLISL